MHIRHLRYRVLLTLTVVELAHVLLTVVLGLWLIVPGFQKQERESLDRNLVRCYESVMREVDHLRSMVTDWASWDDTYEFARTGDPAYIKSNVVPEFMAGEIDINLLYIVDDAGAVLVRMLHDIDRGPLEAAEFPRERCADSLLCASSEADGGVSGLMQTEAGAMLIAARPILTSHNTGPSRGTLVMGRLIDDGLVQHLSDKLQVPFRIGPYTGLPPGHSALTDVLHQRGRVLSEPVDGVSTGFCLLDDFHGERRFLLTARLPVHLSVHARLSVTYAMASSAGAGALLLLANYLLIKRLVLKRTAHVTRFLGDVESSGDLSKRIQVRGEDELSELQRALNRMLERAWIVDESLRHSQQTLQEVFETAPIAMLLLDGRMHIREANEKAARLLDRPLSELMNQRMGGAMGCVNYVTDRCGSGAECSACGLTLQLNAARCGIPVDTDCHLYRCGLNSNDGPQSRWMNVKAQPVRLPEGPHLIVTLEDITAKKEADATLRHARDEAEQARTELTRTNRRLMAAKRASEQHAAEAAEASRLKSRFVSNISHEFRTPMNGIVGFCDAILRCDDIPTARRYAETILRESNHLLMLVNDLLDMAKIEAGRLRLESMPVDLHQVIEEVAQTPRSQAQTKSLGFVLEVAADTPRFVRTDTFRLRQILLNLLSNAIKFTDEGEVGIRAEMTASEGSAHRVRFTVRDSGIGIPHDRQERIFESFTQADLSTTRNYGGTGLGLAIVRELVRLMGGELGLESKPGRGTTVWFTLPLESATAEEYDAAQPPPIPEAPVATRAGRILVAEDHPTNQAVVGMFLEEAGHDVVIVPDGRRAVEACAIGRFDLVFLDVQMPVMDGLEAAHRIRLEGSPNAATPIIAFTANAEPDMQRRCRAAGMCDVVTKPLRRRALLAAVARWLDASIDASPSDVTAPELDPAADAEACGSLIESPMNVARALEEFGDAAGLRHVLDRFLEQTGQQLSEMRFAVEQSDLAALRRHAHKIRGGALTLEAGRMAVWATCLEEIQDAGRMAECAALVDALAAEAVALADLLATGLMDLSETEDAQPDRG